MNVIAHLNFNGRCEEAFTFYARLLGGKIKVMTRHAGTPAEKEVPKRWRDKIIHAHLQIGRDALMGVDAPPGWYEKPRGFSVSLGVSSVTKAERIYRALAKGGKVRMPMAKTFFASRFGMVVDRFGTPWMVMCEKG